MLQEESVSLKSQVKSKKKKLKVMASCRCAMAARILCPHTQEFEENEHFLRTELNNTQQQLQEWYFMLAHNGHEIYLYKAQKINFPVQKNVYV